MNSIEALEFLRVNSLAFLNNSHTDGDDFLFKWHYDSVDQIKKSLDKLGKLEDIIKHKQFSSYAIIDTKNVEEYNNRIRMHNLTKDEYELLKNVLEETK